MTQYKIRQAEPADEQDILRIAREVTDKVTRLYLGDEAVDWYMDSGTCDADMRNDIPNMLLLLQDETIIGMMIWHESLMHFLMIDLPYHGTGAAQYFCAQILPDKLKQYGSVSLECFDKNERGNAFYIKSGWVEHERIPDEMTGGNRIVYKRTK